VSPSKKRVNIDCWGFNQAINTDASLGVIGTQLALDDTLAWHGRKLKAFVRMLADSDYHGMNELIVFAHTDGYVYQDGER
jgi:hypothetical protein